LRCEACGRKIFGKPYKVIIEGARLTVCTDCSKHGKLVWEEEPKPKAAAKPRGPKPTLMIPAKRQPETTPTGTTVELIQDFDAKIRRAREELGFSHDDLGKKINEKVSLLRKIETRKMAPDNLLAAKLERTLKIKLIVPTSEEEIKIPPEKIAKATSRTLTLGDLIELNKKGKEETTRREQS